MPGIRLIPQPDPAQYPHARQHAWYCFHWKGEYAMHPACPHPDCVVKDVMES